MSTTVEFHPNIGSVWSRGLDIWDTYATGGYTTWSFARNGGFPNKAYDITATNPDMSTDTFTLISGDFSLLDVAPIEFLSSNVGFHSTLKAVYTNPLPDGSEPFTSYRDHVWNWRLDIWNWFAGATSDLQNEDDTGSRYGVKTHFIFISHFKDLAVVLDASGIMWGTPTVDKWVGYPTDFVAASPIAIGSSGGGGATDLTPIVQPLKDIALRDVTYSFNNGATIFNMRGKVNV